MKTLPMTEFVLGKVFLLVIICILVNLSTIKSVQFTEYNYTLDVPDIKLNTLYLSKTEQLKIYHGELLKQFLINQPKEIGDVYQVQIFPRNQSTYGQELDDNVIQQVNSTLLKGLWFESFLWPIKQKSSFYTLQRQKSNSSRLKQEIISVAHHSLRQNFTTFNESKLFLLYVLLSSGSIQIVQNQFDTLKVKKQYSFQQIIESNATAQNISWKDGYLYHKRGRLYLFVQQQIFTVILTDTNDGGQISRFFSLEAVGLDNITKTIEDVNDLFAFTQEGCYKIINSTFQLIVNYNDVFSVFNITDGKLIDVAINNNNFYFLQHSLGIIKYSQQRQFSLIRIQHSQMARKLHVFQRTIFVTYQVGVDNYIQEYQFFPQGDKVFVNKIFDYHSDQQVKDVLLFDKYMVINRGPELILSVHSLNRKFPTKFHTKSQILKLNFFLDQIYELRMVRLSYFDFPAYLVVGPHSVQYIRFEQNLQNKMQQKWLKVGSQKPGVFEFYIKYTGTCKLSHFYPSEYCSIKNSIQLIISDAVGEEIRSWWIWLILSIAGIVISVFAWIFAWKYFSKKQNELESIASSRRLKENVSITMSQMQGEKDYDEKTEVN